MKKIILVGLIVSLIFVIFVNGYINPELKLKCYESKEMTLRLINQIDEYNIRPEKYGDNLSYETDIKIYNQLCGDVTDKI